MEERKYKFQKVVFKPKQIGVDIRGGYCSQVRKNSQAYKAGVRTGWRIVNIDGERVPKEDREIASLIRSCIEADDVFPIVFRLPPKDTYAGYKCGDVVEALDSTGRQWNKCLIIDIQKDKFSIVYLHNAVRSKKFQAMLRRIDADEEMDDGEDDWEEEDELEGKRKKKNGKRKKKDKDDVEIEASTKKLLKSAIGKEALADAKEMKKEYARVAAMCNDEDKCDQVFVYLEEKLSSFKHPSRVLKALLLASYLLAYGNDNLSNRVADELEDSIRSAADIDTSAKTSAGKSAVSEIQNRVGPAALQLLDDPKSLAQVRSSVKAQTQAQMSIAPPDGFNSPIHQAPSTTATRAQPSADNAFNNLNALTAKSVASKIYYLRQLFKTCAHKNRSNCREYTA